MTLEIFQLKRRLRTFREHISRTSGRTANPAYRDQQEGVENESDLYDEGRVCRKPKRRSKTLKSRAAAKTKVPGEPNANHGDQHHRDHHGADDSVSNAPRDDPETEIVTSIKAMLGHLQKEGDRDEPPPSNPKDCDETAVRDLRAKEAGDRLEAEYFRSCLQSTLAHLAAHLQKIVAEYRRNWNNDREFGYGSWRGQGDTSSKDAEARECWRSGLEDLEKKYIENLEMEFEKLLVCIRQRAEGDQEVCRVAVGKLERLLVNHRIRGKTVAFEPDPACCFNLTRNPTAAPADGEAFEKDSLYDSCFEHHGHYGLQNNFQEGHGGGSVADSESHLAYAPGESQDVLYYREVQSLAKAKRLSPECNADARKKTLANAYHLVPSIVGVCDGDDDQEIDDDGAPDALTNTSSSSSNIRAHKPKAEYSAVIMQALTKCAEDNIIVGGAKSRWCDLICSLQNMTSGQVLFGGELRISGGSKRHNYVISTGGNFNPVELGLDTNNRALAVKRIPKDSSVCKTLKALLNPLMGIRSSYILHYYICDYEGNDLFFATPLCEFNIGQYVMLLKQMPNVLLTANEAVKQFLKGLMYLHTQEQPIVHGNLKPSNIFVDIHGSVRVAEFGIHKALFKLNEAPDSSIIWFAPETYKTFKESLTMDCTCASDIQVAGMLVHFILTGGKHPYGDETKEILKNLEKATPQLITHDVDLQDLITWMLLYDPNERPAIKQVLTHVYFWSNERKWCFILSCAGITAHGTSLNIAIDAFHRSIDRIAAKENIKGCWVKVIRQKFPKLAFINDDDTPTGLLRFIRSCVEKKTTLDMTNEELCRYILSAFPAFPLSLYRMLESSSWLKHPILTSFTMVDSVLT